MIQASLALKGLIVHDGKILLMHRPTSTIPELGSWEFPGGRPLPNEDLTAALRREVWEETGLQVLKATPLNVHHLKNSKLGFLAVTTFICEVTNPNVRLSAEHPSYGWFGPHELPEGIGSFFIKDIALASATIQKFGNPLILFPAAKAVITYGDETLLLRRTLSNAQKPGMWEIPGGRLNPKEDFLAGLQREVAEETGLALTSAIPLTVRHFERKDGQKIALLTCCAEANSRTIELSDEHTDFAWKPLNQAHETLDEFFHPELALATQVLEKFL